MLTTVLVQDSQTILRWFCVALHLLVEAFAARRDARIRFLNAQVEILRRKLGGNRVIPSPDDRARLLAIGQELDHNVADVTCIVTPQTYSRWVTELREGRRPPVRASERPHHESLKTTSTRTIRKALDILNQRS